MTRAVAPAPLLALGLVLAASASGAAWAQPLDPERPRTLIVGTPPGARADRIDAARTGRARTALPTGGLRSEWRLAVGFPIEQAPLVDASGVTRVVGTRGEVVAIGRDGAELWRVATAAGQPGPAALLSDDTLVFADAAGEAVAVRTGALRWRVRFGRSDAGRPAPLPLDDGGVVVATAHDLAVLDADGRERGRAVLAEDAAGPLCAWEGAILVTGATGTVWRWALGVGEPTRVGTFGSAIDGGIAVAHGVAYAVTAGGAHLAAMDLARGTTVTRAVAPAGLWLGPPTLPAVPASSPSSSLPARSTGPTGSGAAVWIGLLGPTAELAVGLDASGAETARVLLSSRVAAPASPDGGAAAAAAVAHAPLLVDASGTLAFATLEGAIGVAGSADRGAAESLSGVCPPGRGRADDASGVAGLAPLAPGAVVAVCRAGVVTAVRGRAGDAASPRL